VRRVDAADRSSRIRRPDASGNLAAAVALDQRNLVLALQVEPELQPVAAVAAQTHAVIPRRPFRMLVIQPQGTPRSSASRLALKPRAPSSRFSRRPGCTTGGILPIPYRPRPCGPCAGRGAAAFWRRRGFLPSKDDPLSLFRSLPDIAAFLQPVAQ